MKNVFVEGIQGMGKSTLVNRLEAAVPELHVYRRVTIRRGPGLVYVISGSG